jgi:hypothetical protein
MDESRRKAVRKLPAMTWLGTTALTITAALRDHQTIQEKLALTGDLQASLRIQRAEILRRDTTALTIAAALRDHQAIHEKLALIGDLQVLLKRQRAEILRRDREPTKGALSSRTPTNRLKRRGSGAVGP